MIIISCLAHGISQQTGTYSWSKRSWILPHTAPSGDPLSWYGRDRRSFMDFGARLNVRLGSRAMGVLVACILPELRQTKMFKLLWVSEEHRWVHNHAWITLIKNYESCMYGINCPASQRYIYIIIWISGSLGVTWSCDSVCLFKIVFPRCLFISSHSLLPPSGYLFSLIIY